MQQITVQELKSRMDSEQALPLLLDIREPWEIGKAALPYEFIRIPMRDLADRVNELPRGQETVIVCHHGVRSFHVAAFLESIGFTNICNLAGGIDAWSRLVDSDIPIY